MLLDDDDINKRGIIDIRHGSVLPILLFFAMLIVLTTPTIWLEGIYKAMA
jgi:hypothetical protein